MLSAVIQLSHTDGTSCYDAVLKLFPDLVLHFTDEYLAAIVQEVQMQIPEVQTIFVVCGHGQSRTIPHYLFMSPKFNGEIEATTALESITALKPVYSSVMATDTV